MLRVYTNLRTKRFDNDIPYNQILLDCRKGKVKQKLIYQGTNITNQLWGFPVVYNRSFNVMFFDPWTGLWIKESVDMYDESLNIDTEASAESQEQYLLHKIFLPNRALHSKERYCTLLESATRSTERCETSLIEISNLRVIAVLNKVKYGGWNRDKFDLFFRRRGYQGLDKWEFDGWTALDYCPYCGAKLPERLDKKIIEVLSDELGLTSWKSYKKAPLEFKIDEWWRKRGL